MKVVILAGGFGTRLAEHTELIPKPLVPIGRYPVLWHIMNIYAHYGHKEFVVACGYRAEAVKSYFLQFHAINADFTVDLGTGKWKVHVDPVMREYYKNMPHDDPDKRRYRAVPFEVHSVPHEDPVFVDWKVSLVDTGPTTMTGGRIKRLADFVGRETCCLTYGDGVSNVDIQKELEFHKSHGKIATMTCVHPPARFGTLDIRDGLVHNFQEKAPVQAGWINGGFFILEPEVLNYIDGDGTSFEKEPLERLAADRQLVPYMHEGFWHCMDTKKDLDYLTELWNSGKAPWKIW
ncbi:MAG: glucose-1-phosphate cytidylyltransferase [Candidatus Eremiobacteraeota bacterium]|nr:glucose-1-phosphate cytidylyltransferase [Candidatus Eremiobacteraeota bacterium]